MVISLAELWFGEDGSSIFPRVWWAAVTGLLGVAAVWRIASASRYAVRSVAAIACGAVSIAAFLIGDREATHAYNYCVDHGEEIRSRLAAYRERKHTYPTRLDMAVEEERLCTRTLRGSILRYSATASMYKLEFGDYLVSFTATDQEPFTAVK